MFYHIFHTMVLQTCIDNSLKHPNLSIMEDFKNQYLFNLGLNILKYLFVTQK